MGLVLYPQLALSLPREGELPASWQEGDRAVVLLPGRKPSARIVVARVGARAGGVVSVVARSWNAPQVEARCVCVEGGAEV